jgi:hypothetical protein
VFDDDVANGGSAAQRFERHLRSQKNMPGARVAWSPIAEITGQGPGDGRQQRQRERHAGLGPHERSGAPVDVIHRKPNRFNGTAAMDAHQQQKCVVALSNACGSVDRLQQALDILPGQGAPRTLISGLYRGVSAGRPGMHVNYDLSHRRKKPS